MPASRKKKRWSQRVTETSDALTLDEGVFSRDDPRSIARSLKRSADRSGRRKSEPYRSAMSMLTFYINRAGKNMPAKHKRTLQAAKGELRRLYGKDEGAEGAARKRSTSRKKQASSKKKRTSSKKKRPASKKRASKKKRARSSRR